MIAPGQSCPEKMWLIPMKELAFLIRDEEVLSVMHKMKEENYVRYENV